MTRKKLIKLSLGGIALVGFIAAGIATTKDSDPQMEAAMEFLESNKTNQIIQNAYFLRDQEDLFNYEGNRLTSGSLFSEGMIHDKDTLNNDQYQITLYPNYFIGSSSESLQSERYLKNLEKGKLLGYLLRLNIKSEKVTTMKGLVILESAKQTFDTIVIDDQIDLQDYALTETIATQKLYVENSKKQIAKDKEQKAKILESQERFMDECLSSYDGAHDGLREYVTNSLNDPSSFEHIETVFWTLDDIVIVQMDYRAKNAFGALMKARAKARVSYDCEIVEILQVQ